MKPVIFGLSGPTLTDVERTLFREDEPAGYNLFKRNIEDREQLRALTDTLSAQHGRADLAIMIDQEGGRDAGMKPPIWPALPHGAVVDRRYALAPGSVIKAARAYWNTENT